ncbi:MAG: hemerythrin domain-containing protein [Bernardetiaceae bacterium]|nr:hemerythrin domain-containing protein [Bernardetiaceae bacterium]
MNRIVQRVSEIVEENYRLGAAFYNLGIDFQQYAELPLQEVCRIRSLDANFVCKQLEQAAQPNTQKPHWENLTIELIINYLKHTHRIFMRYKLPYMRNLVMQSEKRKFPQNYSLILSDLQIAFPLFAEDFIRHILDEENTLFTYIENLDRVACLQMPASKIYFQMEKYNIADFAHAHHDDDDEMQGIRELTQDYYISEGSPLAMRVLYSELQAFEQDLKVHANIENNVLFPKAAKLEAQVKKQFLQIRPLN